MQLYYQENVTKVWTNNKVNLKNIFLGGKELCLLIVIMGGIFTPVLVE